MKNFTDPINQKRATSLTSCEKFSKKHSENIKKFIFNGFNINTKKGEIIPILDDAWETLTECFLKKAEAMHIKTQCDNECYFFSWREGRNGYLSYREAAKYVTYPHFIPDYPHGAVFSFAPGGLAVFIAGDWINPEKRKWILSV